MSRKNQPDPTRRHEYKHGEGRRFWHDKNPNDTGAQGAFYRRPGASPYYERLTSSLDRVVRSDQLNGIALIEDAPLYDETILALGPQGYWKFDESGGSIITDSSGYGHDGSFGGASTWAWSQPALCAGGSSIRFLNGNLHNLSSLIYQSGGDWWQNIAASGLTVGVWVKANTVSFYSTYYQVIPGIAMHTNQGSACRWKLVADNDDGAPLSWVFKTYNGSFTPISEARDPDTALPGQTYFAVGVVEPDGTTKVYINGALKASDNAVGIPTPYELTMYIQIGSAFMNPMIGIFQGADGWYDNAFLIPYALTEPQIADLYVKGSL